MQATVHRLTLCLLILGLTSNAWALERKAEWAQYSRSKPLIERTVAPAPKLKLTRAIDQISYSIGMSIGEDIKSRNIQINGDILARGITDTIRGEGMALSKEQAMQVLAKLQDQLNRKQTEEAAQAAFKNLQDGRAFLAKNAKKPGVTVTESGLQYEIITAGTGATPTGEDIVVVDYRGAFINGEEFDSSYSRGEPVEFSVNGIIPGWTEALLMMKEGAKWKLAIPADLAYGAQGAAPIIGPNTTLVFEVELQTVKK